MLRIASIQLEIKDGEHKPERLKKVEQIIRNLPVNTDLAMLPECWPTGYFSFDQYHEEAETLDGPTISCLASLAKETKMFIHTGSLIEKKGDQFFNTSVLLDRQGNMVAVYRKIHLFGFGSKETQLLSPGRDVVVTETDLGKIGLATCYDLRFPELYRKMVDKGAEIFLVCAAWPFPRIENWVALNQVRALENQAYLISSNCCGTSHGKQLLGKSLVVDPWGTITAGAGHLEKVILTEIDLKEVETCRQVFPPLVDRVL